MGKNLDTNNIILIEHGKMWSGLGIADVFKGRHVLYFLVWRDIKIRYKQTFLGLAWALIQPLLTMLVLTFVFGYLVRVSTGEVGYSLFSLAGIVPWTLFASCATRSAGSLISNSHFMSRVYFPRLALPFSAAGVPLVDALVAFILLIGLTLINGHPVTPGLLLALPCLVLVVLLGQAVGIVLASVMVWVRDVRQVLPLMFQLWMFATPVAYPMSMVPPRFDWVMTLNPMTGPVEAFRAVVLTGTVPWSNLLVTLAFLVVLFVLGMLLFRRAAQRIIDIL